MDDLRGQIDLDEVEVMSIGTTGSARRLVGAMLDAQVVKNEITAHAVGTTFLHPDVRTISRSADRTRRSSASRTASPSTTP